jgi:hypothetical protein
LLKEVLVLKLLLNRLVELLVLTLLRVDLISDLFLSLLLLEDISSGSDGLLRLNIFPVFWLKLLGVVKGSY